MIHLALGAALCAAHVAAWRGASWGTWSAAFVCAVPVARGVVLAMHDAASCNVPTAIYALQWCHLPVQDFAQGVWWSAAFWTPTALLFALREAR